MSNTNDNNILQNKKQLGHFSMEKIKKVDLPTNLLTQEIQRTDFRNNPYQLAARGEYGPLAQKGVKSCLPAKYPISAAQKDIIDHIALIKPNPINEQIAPISQDSEVLTRHIKSTGYFLKADIVGACKVPAWAYYSHDINGKPIEPKYENAIVIVMRKDWNTMHASSGFDWIGDPVSFQCYQHLGMAAETMANYIRRLGWDASAQYGPSFINHYSVVLPPLLILAGIGEISRVGIVLNPYLGLSYKAAVILTNMPIVADKPIDFGLQRFCQSCHICADNCPSEAIAKGDKILHNGYETWKLNSQRCASFNFIERNGTMCNKCVKSCPWSNPSTFPHNLVRNMVINSHLAQSIAIKTAPLLGSNKSHPEEKWWFDMSYSGDTLISREKN